MQNKQNLFSEFQKISIKNSSDTSIYKLNATKKQNLSGIESFHSKLLQKNSLFNTFKAKNYEVTFFSSIPLLKKSQTTQAISYGQDSHKKQEILQITLNYLISILQNQTNLRKDKEKLNFINFEQNCIWMKSLNGKQISNKLTFSDNMNYTKVKKTQQHQTGQLSRMNLTKSVSIQCINNNNSYYQAKYICPHGNQKTIDICKQQNEEQEEKQKIILECFSQVNSSEVISKCQINSSSTTSFQFTYDQKIVEKKNKDLLNSVQHYIRNSQQNLNLQLSDVSIQICKELTSKSWFSESDSDQVDGYQLMKKAFINFNQQFLCKLYVQHEPFLITISLVYFLKYLNNSKQRLNMKNISILLTVSLLIAYKIYYDEQLIGLMQYLTVDVLQSKVNKQEMAKIERNFLEAIQYGVMISSEQFYKMLQMIISRKSPLNGAKQSLKKNLSNNN